MPLSRGPRALEPRGAVDPFPLEIAQARGSIVTPAQRVLETPQEAGRGRGSAIQLALAAAQTAAKAVSSSPPAACALTADLDKLIDRVFLPLFKRGASVSARGRRLEKRQLRAENFCAGAGAATRPGGGVPGEASAHEGGEERQERDKKRQRQNCVHDGEMAASDGKGCGASSPDGSHVCYDSLVDTARGPTGEQPRRGSRSETELFVGLECLAAEAAELSDDSSDATDSDDGGDGTCMHGTPYRTVLADSAAEASDQASSNDEAVALLPRGIFRESRASCRRQAHAEARMRLSLFARHPVAWSLCLRALEQAAVVASSGLFPLRSESAEKSRASKLLLVSSLRRRIALFSTSSLSLAGADDVSEQTGAFLEAPDETELERRLLCRAFFAARLLLLLADAGLPFLQLPLSPPQLSRPTPGRSACAPSSPSSGAESAKGVHGRGDDDFLQIAPSLCYGGEMPFLLCPEDAHAPPSPWSHAGESAFRVSPFVSLRLSPPPLAAPQLLHRELSSLLHCCCLFTSLSLSRDASDDPAPPLRREGEAARLPDKETFHRGHEARGNGTGVGERQGGTAAPPHTGCALWRAEISETLSEAAASLVVHTVAQQQLEGGTSVPLLQQKTGLQRAVSLVRLFCFSSSESEPFPASVGRPCPSSSECPRGAASRGKGTCVAGVAPWLVFARVCVGLVRALVGLAEGSPSSAGRDHLSSSAHRSLFQASFLRESPLLLLLLQEAVSLALSLLRSDSPTGRAPEHASAHLASSPATEPRHVSCSALEPSRCSRSPARELDAPASASLSTAEKEEGRRRRAMPVRHSREKRAPANVEVPSMVLPSQTCSLPGLRTEARVRLQPAVRRFCDELLVAALEAARRLLRFWSARLGEEAERRQRRQRAAGNANEERVKKVAEVKEIRPRSDSGSASPSPRTKREKDETQGDSPSRGAAASASHGRKKGRPANLEQTQPKREEASGGTLPEDDAKLTHDEGALITCAFEEGPLAGVAAAFGVGGGEVVRRFVESLLFVLEALPDAASSIEEESCASTSSPRSEVPPSSASSFEPLSSSAFLGTETKLHALSSEIVALLFSLPISLFLLSPCLPPRHMQASPSFASSVSPFVSAAGEAAPDAASLAASYPLLSVWCASDMPVGGLFAAVDAAARAAPQSLPQLLSWFQLRVNDSLARVALALLPPLASPSAPQLAAFPKRVLHLLLHWTLPLSKQLVPSLLMSHLLPCCASGAGRGEQGDEPWSCARAGATALPPSPRRKREKRAKREGEGGTHEAKSWVQPEPCVETSALAKRLGLPLVGCLCTPEEAPRAEEAGARRPSGSHAAGDSVGESGAAGVGARVSRRRQATCRDETERDAKAKVEPDWKAREPVEKAGSAAGIDADERSALSASSFASSLVVVRLLARVLHSRCLSDDDTLAAVQSLSVIFSPFLALRAASPSANGAEKTSGLPDDCREGQQHCGKRGGSRDGGCHDKQNGEIAGREKWRSELYEKKILDALRCSLEHHGLLMELLDAIVYAATLWRPVAGVGRSEAGAEDASGGGSGEERRALSVSQEHADAVQDSWELRLERRDACACLLQQLVLLFGDSLLPGLNQLLDRVTSPPSLDLASQTSTDARASSPWAAEAVCEGVLEAALEAAARARPGSRSRASSSASWLPSARPGDGGEGVESETAEEMAAAEASLWACCAARRAACLGDLQAPETCAGVHVAALRVLESYRKRRAETRCGSTWSPAAGDGDAKEGPRGLGGGTASRAPTVELPRLLREAAPHRGGERVVAEHLGRRFAGCELDGWRLLPAVGAAVCLAFSSDCFASRACPGSRHEATKKERPDDAARLGGGLVSAAVGVCGAADLALSLAQLAEDLAQCAASCRRAWRWPFSGLHGSPERRAAEARGLHAFGLRAFLWRELRVALLRVLVRLNANLLAAPLARRPAKGEVSPSPEAAKEAGTSPVREASSGCRGEALASGVKRARDADEGTEPRGTCGDATVSLLRDLQLHLQRALWLLLRGELPSGADLIEGATGRRRGGSTLASASPVFRFLPSEAGLEDGQLAAVLSASLCLLARRLGEAGQIGDASRRDGLSPVSAKASQSHKARSSTGSNSKEALARVALIAPWLSTRRVPGGEAPTPDAEGAPADDADVPSTDGLPALLASGHYRVLQTRDGAEGGQSDERELARRVSLHFAALRAWLLATQAGMPDRARREIEAKAPREDKKRRCAPNGFETKDAESKLSPLVCEGREQVPDVESLWTLQVEFLHSCLLHRENFFSALVSAASHSPPGACEAASPLGSEAAEALRSDGPTSQVPQPRRGQSPAPQPASPALLAAVCRSATLAFSSFSRALSPSSPLVHSGSCAATGRQSKARSEREGRRGKLRILRALLQLMTRACFFSRADSRESLALLGADAPPAKGSSSPPPKRLAEERDGSAKWPAAREPAAEGEEISSLNTPRCNALRSLDAARTAAVVTTGLLPLIQVVGTSSPGCACGAEERMLLLDTVCTLLWSLLDQVATRRLHPSACSCCSCERAAGKECRVSSARAAPEGAVHGLATMQRADALGAGGDMKDAGERDLECRLAGGCCPRCAQPVMASLTRARLGLSSLLRALMACFSFPLILLAMLNGRQGFAALQRFFNFLVPQGGLRALQTAVQESRRREALFRALLEWRASATCPSRGGVNSRAGLLQSRGPSQSARLDKLLRAAREREELEEALELTLQWLLRVVRVSRKDAPWCFPKTLDLAVGGGGAAGGEAAGRPRGMQPNDAEKVTGGCGGDACLREGDGGARRRKRTQFDVGLRPDSRRDLQEETDAETDLRLGGYPEGKALSGRERNRCSCCGDPLTDEGELVFHDQEDDSRGDPEAARLATGAAHEGCRVDRETLSWSIEESCARAATALLQCRMKVPLSRILRQELLLRFGFSASTQDALLRRPLQSLYSFPPAFAFAFPGVSPPAPGGTLSLLGRSPEAVAVASWAPPPLQPVGAAGSSSTGASGPLGGGGGQQPQAVLVGLQQHQALQSMEEQMIRTLETQQMVEGVAEENEGTDGSCPVLVEVLLHIVCSLLFGTRGETTPVENAQWTRLFFPLLHTSPLSPPPVASSEEVESRHRRLLFALLTEVLLPPAARAFSANSSGGFFRKPSSAPADCGPFPACLGGSALARPSVAVAERPEGRAGAGDQLRSALTVPPRIRLRRWPYIFTFHLLASSCLPQWGTSFLRRSSFACCCPCCPSAEGKASIRDADGAVADGGSLTASGSGAPLQRPPYEGNLVDGGRTAPPTGDGTAGAKGAAFSAHRWCACCYCFPQPHSPCIKALTTGNSSLSSVPAAPIAAAASAAARAAARLPAGSPPPSSGSSCPVVGVAPLSAGACGDSLASSLIRDTCQGDRCGGKCGEASGPGADDGEPLCAPASLAVFVSTVVAAAFKPHLFSMLDTNASYATNMWESTSVNSLAATVGIGGAASGVKGEKGEGGGSTAMPASGRGPAASAAASAATEQNGAPQSLQLPYLLQSPPTFLLHPLQEILLEGLPRRFSSLLAGVQAPQPSIVPPLARLAAAVSQALQFTATQQSTVAEGDQLQQPPTFQRDALFALVEELHKRFFAVDFLRIGSFLQQQQILHRHRQLDGLIAMGRGVIGGSGVSASSCEGDYSASPRASSALGDAGGVVALAAGLGAAAAAGDVLAQLRLMAPATPSGVGSAASPSAKETVSGKGNSGSKFGAGACGGAFGHTDVGGGMAGDPPRKAGPGGGKGKGKRRD